MTLKLLHAGRKYTWIEKGPLAGLTLETGPKTTLLLWSGNPCDPVSLHKLNDLKEYGVTLDMLLRLSAMRNAS